jgi:hypothetical protein
MSLLPVANPHPATQDVLPQPQPLPTSQGAGQPPPFPSATDSATSLTGQWQRLGPKTRLTVVAVALFLILVVVLGMMAGKGMAGKSSRPGLPNARREGMTLAAYLAQRPDKPTVLGELSCKLDNYYNFDYRDSAQTHYSVNLFSEVSFTHAHAWVSKDSAAGRRIFAALQDGRAHPLTLKVVLEGPYGTPTPPGRQEMAIVEVMDD